MEIQAYFTQQNQLFLENFKQSIQEDNKEVIHQMRVALKKIFAITTFLYKTDLMTKKDRSEQKAVKHLFSVAGNLRDAHIRLELMDQYSEKFSNPPILYAKRLSKQILQEHSLWKEEAKKFSKEQHINFCTLLEHKIGALPQKIIHQQARLFILGLIQQMETILLSHSWMQQLHLIRIRLKRMHLIYQLYRPNSDVLLPEQLKELELMLGRWHDHFILRSDVLDFQTCEKDQCHEIIVILKREMDALAIPIRQNLLKEFSLMRQELSQ